VEQLKEEKMMAEKSKFEEELEKLNINLTEHQKEQFDRYYEMLVEWNNVMNLTGITDYDEVNLKHFTDSLTLVRNIDMNKIDAVIDIGTGAGFPGLPIKIAFPHIHVVLLDSLNKRIKFLNAVIEELDLADVETLHGRAEDYAKRSIRFMAAQKIWHACPNIENSLIFAYRELLQIYQL
jgi:16S rRNA (guanine527-N7)-methyltransferase